MPWGEVRMEVYSSLLKTGLDRSEQERERERERR
jgi:hypothetical protein